MTTENLREFITLAEVGNYAAAAEPLFISEATLSRHIMALEKEIGAELFKRLPRRIELTEIGLIFLTYAKQIIAAENSCIAALQQKVNFGKSSLTIGFDEAMAYYGVPQLIAAFQKEHPEIMTQISQADTFSLTEQVESGLLQFAFIIDDRAKRSENLKYIDFTTDTLCAVLPKASPAASQEVVLLNALVSEKLLMPPPLTAMYEICVKAFRRADVEPKAAVTSPLESKGAHDLIKNGIYACATPSAIAKEMECENVAALSIAPKFEIVISLIYSDAALSQAGEMFIRHIEEAKIRR